MKLPNYPTSGKPVKAEWGRQVVDYLRSLTPRSSPTIKPSHTPGGTMLSLKPPKRTSSEGSSAKHNRVFVAGELIRENYNMDPTKPYVSVNYRTQEVTEFKGSFPASFPKDTEIYEKESVFGDIHITGLV